MSKKPAAPSPFEWASNRKNKRAAYVMVRVSTPEQQLIKKAADKLGLSVANWLRMVLMPAARDVLGLKEAEAEAKDA